MDEVLRDATTLKGLNVCVFKVTIKTRTLPLACLLQAGRYDRATLGVLRSLPTVGMTRALYGGKYPPRLAQLILTLSHGGCERHCKKH